MEHINLFQFGQAGSLREARLTHFADSTEKPKAETEKVETAEARLARLRAEALSGITAATDIEAVQVRIDDADKKFQELKDEHKTALAAIKSQIDKILTSTDPAVRKEALQSINERVIEIATYIDASTAQLALEFKDSNRPYNAEVQHETFLKWLVDVQVESARLEDPIENKKKVEAADTEDAKAVDRIKEDVVIEKRAIETAVTNSLHDNVDNYKTDVQKSVANLQGKLDAVRALSPVPRNLVAQERAIQEGMDTLVKHGKQSMDKRFKELGKVAPVEAALDSTFVDDVKAERTKFDTAIKDSKFAEAKTVRSAIEAKLKGIDSTDAQYFAKREALGKELGDMNKAMEKAGAERNETRVQESERQLKEISEGNTKLIDKLKKQKDDSGNAATSTERVKLNKDFRTDLAAAEQGIVKKIEALQSDIEGNTAPFNAQEQMKAHVKSLQMLEDTFRSNEVGANKPEADKKPEEKKEADNSKPDDKKETKEEVKLPDSLSKPVGDLKKALENPTTEKNKLDPTKWGKVTLAAKAALDSAFKALKPEERIKALPAIKNEFAGYIVTEKDGTLNFDEKPKNATEVDRSKFTEDQLDILDKMEEGMMKEILKVLFIILNKLKTMKVEQLKDGKTDILLGEEKGPKAKAEADLAKAKAQLPTGPDVSQRDLEVANRRITALENLVRRLENQERQVSNTQRQFTERFRQGDMDVQVTIREGRMDFRDRRGSMSGREIRLLLANDRQMAQLAQSGIFVEGDSMGFDRARTEQIVFHNYAPFIINNNEITASNSTVAANLINGTPANRSSAKVRAAKPTTKSETPKSETPKSETPKSETPKSETPKSETPKSETPKSETPKSETPKSETPKSEPPTQELPPAKQDRSDVPFSG